MIFFHFPAICWCLFCFVLIWLCFSFNLLDLLRSADKGAVLAAFWRHSFYFYLFRLCVLNFDPRSDLSQPECLEKRIVGQTSQNITLSFVLWNPTRHPGVFWCAWGIFPFTFKFVQVEFSVSLWSRRCVYALVRFRHRSRSVRIRGTLWFGSKYLFWRLQTHLRRPDRLQLQSAVRFVVSDYVTWLEAVQQTEEIKNSLLWCVKMQTEHILQVKRSNKHKHLLNPSLAFESLITDIVGVSWVSSASRRWQRLCGGARGGRGGRW